MADPATFIATWFTPSSLFIFVNLVIGTIAITSRLTTSPKNQPQLPRSPSLLERVRSFRHAHYNNHYEESQTESTQPQLVRTPSLSDRVSSFHLSHHNNHYEEESQTESTQPQLVRTPSLLERVRSFILAFYKPEPTHSKTEYAQPQPSELENPEPVPTPSLLQKLQSMNFSCISRSNSSHREEEDPGRNDSEPGRGDSVNSEKSRAEMRKSASEKGGSRKMEWEEEGAVERWRPATARGETASFKGDEEVDAKADDFIDRFKKQLRLQRADSIIRNREMIRGSN